MTDSFDPIGSREERLASLIASRNVHGTDASTPVTTVMQSTRPTAVRYDSYHGRLIDLNTGAEVSPDAELYPSALIPDDGRNLDAELARIEAEIARLEAKRDERIFRTDGTSYYRLSDDERAALDRAVKQLKGELEYQKARYEELRAQRERLAAAQAAALAEQEERERRIEKMTQEELDRLEAQKRAREIYARKYARSSGL